MTAQIALIIAGLVVAGGVASWIAGAIFCWRMLHAQQKRNRGLIWLALLAWPFATGRGKGATAAHVARVNKALVTLFACVTVGVAAWSLAANLQRIAR